MLANVYLFFAARTQVGYKSILHIHAGMEECEITKLVAEIDMKTKEQKKSRFVKTGTHALRWVKMQPWMWSLKEHTCTHALPTYTHTQHTHRGTVHLPHHSGEAHLFGDFPGEECLRVWSRY